MQDGVQLPRTNSYVRRGASSNCVWQGYFCTRCASTSGTHREKIVGELVERRVSNAWCNGVAVEAAEAFFGGMFSTRRRELDPVQLSYTCSRTASFLENAYTASSSAGQGPARPQFARGQAHGAVHHAYASTKRRVCEVLA
eukprot:3622350-Pleurochrysis_carterae.AAC.1